MNRQRAAGLAIISFNLAFVCLMGVATHLYPGGTWLEPERVGHSFWENFLCDLLHTHALSGADNRAGALWARAAMLAEAAALVAMWWHAPRLFSKRTALGTAIRSLGLLSALGTVCVVLLPSDRYGGLHGVMVIVASVPGFGAAVLSVYGLLLAGATRSAGLFGVAALLTSLVSFVLYSRTQFWDMALSASVPASQRVATFAVVAFCLSVAQRLLAPAPSAQSQR